MSSDAGDLLARSARALLDRPRAGDLVLLVDDAHLLDDLSAGLIHQLAATHGVHVVLTVRSGEAVPEPITALWKDDVVRRVELGSLDRPRSATCSPPCSGARSTPRRCGCWPTAAAATRCCCASSR